MMSSSLKRSTELEAQPDPECGEGTIIHGGEGSGQIQTGNGNNIVIKGGVGNNVLDLGDGSEMLI